MRIRNIVQNTEIGYRTPVAKCAINKRSGTYHILVQLLDIGLIPLWSLVLHDRRPVPGDRVPFFHGDWFWFASVAKQMQMHLTEWLLTLAAAGSHSFDLQ